MFYYSHIVWAKKSTSWQSDNFQIPSIFLTALSPLHTCSSLVQANTVNMDMCKFVYGTCYSFMSQNTAFFCISVELLSACLPGKKNQKTSLLSLGTRQRSTTKLSASLSRKWSWPSWLGFKGWNMNPRRRHQHKFICCCELIYLCVRLLELIFTYTIIVLTIQY